VAWVDLDDPSEKQLNLALNRISGDWDDVALRELLQGLDAEGADLELTGFDDAELARLLQNITDGNTDDDAVPSDVEKRCEPGDLWQLGDHRLLCGDATSADDVARLLGGARAALAFTSPPYNVGVIALRKVQKYQDDSDDKTAGAYTDLLVNFTRLALSCCDFVFVNVQSLAANKISLIDYMHTMRGEYADSIVWDKCTAEPAMASNVLNSRFEYVHAFSSKANRSLGTAEFRGTLENIIAIPSRSDKAFSGVHKATFPVELAQWFVVNFCKHRESVLDPFCGTGTTLVACEKLARKCYALEISAEYCDVILQRWERFTDRKAERINGEG
jgi:DNA modification methylase